MNEIISVNHLQQNTQTYKLILAPSLSNSASYNSIIQDAIKSATNSNNLIDRKLIDKNIEKLNKEERKECRKINFDIGQARKKKSRAKLGYFIDCYQSLKQLVKCAPIGKHCYKSISKLRHVRSLYPVFGSVQTLIQNISLLTRYNRDKCSEINLNHNFTYQSFKRCAPLGANALINVDICNEQVRQDLNQRSSIEEQCKKSKSVMKKLLYEKKKNGKVKPYKVQCAVM